MKDTKLYLKKKAKIILKSCQKAGYRLLITAGYQFIFIVNLECVPYLGHTFWVQAVLG